MNSRNYENPFRNIKIQTSGLVEFTLGPCRVAETLKILHVAYSRFMYCEDSGFQGFGVPKILEALYKNPRTFLMDGIGIDDSVGIGISEANDLLYSDERLKRKTQNGILRHLKTSYECLVNGATNVLKK